METTDKRTPGRKPQEVSSIEILQKKEYINNSEAQLFTGLHRNTLRKYRTIGTSHAGRLPFRKLGNTIIYRRIDLINFIEKHTA